MRFSVKKESFEDARAEVLIVGVNSGGKRLRGGVARLNRRTSGALSKAMEVSGFSGELKEVVFAPAPRTGAKKILLVGLGEIQDLDVAALKDAMGSAASACQKQGIKSAAVLVPTSRSTHVRDAAEATCRGLLLASYDPGLYKTEEKERKKAALSRVSLLCDAKNADTELKAGAARGNAMAAGVLFTRDLVNRPSNELTPRMLAKEAKSLARSPLVKCRVFGPAECGRKGMGGLLGVGQGSAEPVQFIALEYKPARLPKKAPKIAIVGKGITFDTGGISLKPSANMDQMKFDMGGAGAVLGAFKILSLLKPAVHVLGYVAAAENMPGGKAIKPGDLLRMMSGLTVEVNNTDAEGRLVLADALHYAKLQKPDFIVDAATLTGACMVALGEYACGLMSEDDELVRLIEGASKLSGDAVWRLPLSELHRTKMKGHVADLKNTGTRDGGASTAAGFLSCFATGARWAHLDIAGMVWAEENRPTEPKGATGFGACLFYCIAEAAAKST
jgi:leucyl aminopeptidase